MNVAYLILAHKNAKQVKRFIEKLKEDVYVHIDLKSNIDEFFINKKNVKFLKNRVDIGWGDFSMIQATLNLLRSSMKKDYDYYVLLSGDDYLIKKEEEFIDILKNDPSKIYIEYEDFKEEWKDRYKKYKFYNGKNIIFRSTNKLINLVIGHRKMINDLKPYKGSQWWCLNNKSVNYIIKYIDENKNVLKFFKYTHIPDEMFFQTILLNSHLKKYIINDNLRYIDLKGCHPEIITIKNINKILNEKNKFFARKFDINRDEKVLDFLDTKN